MHLNLQLSLTHLPYPSGYVQFDPHDTLALLNESLCILPLPNLPLILLLHPPHLRPHPLDLQTQPLLLQAGCLQGVVTEHIVVGYSVSRLGLVGLLAETAGGG